MKADKETTTLEAEIDDRLGRIFPGPPPAPPPSEDQAMATKKRKSRATVPRKPVKRNGNGEKSSLTQQVEAFEAKLIMEALKKAKGSIRQAAADLGTYRGALYKKIERLGINAEVFR